MFTSIKIPSTAISTESSTSAKSPTVNRTAIPMGFWINATLIAIQMGFPTTVNSTQLPIRTATGFSTVVRISSAAIAFPIATLASAMRSFCSGTFFSSVMSHKVAWMPATSTMTVPSMSPIRSISSPISSSMAPTQCLLSQLAASTPPTTPSIVRVLIFASEPYRCI